MKRIIFYAFWAIAIYFALRLAGIALAYFSFDMDYHFLKSKQDMLEDTTWLVFFYVHLLFGVTATLSGFPLFFKRLIHFRSYWHKQIGKLYIFSILLFTGPTGLFLSFSAEGGPWASVGFIGMSLAWMIPTYMAYYHIINKNLRGHYKWIIRSYCMTLSGVTLRLFTPIGSHFVGFEEETNFIISAYVWIFNVILAEIILFLNRPQLENLDEFTALTPKT